MNQRPRHASHVETGSSVLHSLEIIEAERLHCANGNCVQVAGNLTADMVATSGIMLQADNLNLVSILVLGFVLGMRHATDADHVIAVSTIISRERRLRSAALIGGLWGVGHTLTILAVGVGIIVFTLVIPPRVGLSMEFSVGVMLVVLGLVNLRSVSEGWRSPAASEVSRHISHSHAGVGEHTHSIEKSLSTVDRWFGNWTVYQWLRPLIVGLVHGLAGSAAVALLVLATLRDSRWAVAYLFLFGIGTIAGMMIITLAMSSALHYAGSKSHWINKRLSLATGVVSVMFGLFIVYQMGFHYGLFTGHPNWTPQ